MNKILLSMLILITSGYALADSVNIKDFIPAPGGKILIENPSPEIIKIILSDTPRISPTSVNAGDTFSLSLLTYDFNCGQKYSNLGVKG